LFQRIITNPFYLYFHYNTNHLPRQLAGLAAGPAATFCRTRAKASRQEFGSLRLQQLFTPAATAKLAAAGPTSGVLLIKNMTVFLTFCSLHIFGISAWMVYRSWHQVCQATLPNFLADFCDKFLPQLPVVPRRARCVDWLNPQFRNKKWQTSGRLRVCGFGTFVPGAGRPACGDLPHPLRQNVAGSLGVCELATTRLKYTLVHMV
jgi:hypothetical protein